MCLWALVRSLTLKTHTRKASVTWNSVWTHTVTVKERRTFIVDCRANDRVYEFINWVYSVPRLWKSWTTAQWATNRQRKSERAKMKWNKTAATTIAYLARIELIYLCVFVCVYEHENNNMKKKNVCVYTPCYFATKPLRMWIFRSISVWWAFTTTFARGTLGLFHSLVILNLWPYNSLYSFSRPLSHRNTSPTHNYSDTHTHAHTHAWAAQHWVIIYIDEHVS